MNSYVRPDSGKFKIHSTIFALTAGFASLFSVKGLADTTEQTTAQNIFRRLTGMQLAPTDQRITQMADLIKKGDVKRAALIATEDVQFLSGTIVPLAAKLGSFEMTPMYPFNDFQALYVGIVRDNIDAREMLTANYAYQFTGTNTDRKRDNNTNYEFYDAVPNKLAPSNLVKVSPQWPDQPDRDTAGLLTTRGWAEAHFNGGTNRRAVERTFNMFLCSPIEKWRDVTVSDYNVGRDVDRVPSGDPTTYQTTCRGCHGSMDGMRPAFGHFDFANGRFGYLGAYQIATKYNIHANVFPQAPAVATDDWINHTTESYDSYFGWRGQTEGAGIRSFGEMIANSQAFKTCFASRAFTAVCRRDPVASDQNLLSQLANDFESDKYSVKALFANTAAKANCF